MRHKKKALTQQSAKRLAPSRKPRKALGDDLELISADILSKHPGKHVVYSDLERRVIGVGDTLKEAFRQAEASGAPQPWHSAYADPPDTYYVF